LKDRNKNLLLLALGAMAALFMVEATKEKPFEGVKSTFRKIVNKLKGL
jgi:hypothetical protein